MLNRYVRLAALLIVTPIFVLFCQKPDETRLSEIPTIQIEPYRPCDSTSHRTEIHKEVAKGFILDSVSRFPESKTRIPQHSIDFNFISDGFYTENTRIDIYVSARNRTGKILIGHTWIPREHPPIHQWKRGICFPVSCPINLPLSRNDLSWEIRARIGMQGKGSKVINLGDVTLVSN